MPIVLASNSPRRRELIGLIFPDAIIRPPQVREEEAGDWTPAEYALKMASLKARWVSLGCDQLVLGADTVVALGAKIFGKPGDPEKNRAMLAELSGKWHAVLTGVAWWRQGVCLAQEVVVTRVHFFPLSQGEIADYVQGGEGLDKAGGYAIQGLAAKFVAGIDGCYYNVVGLPVAAVARLYQGLK